MSHDLRRISYTAASAIPLKVVRHPTCHSGIQMNRIFPVHVQFIPTDRCNLNCAWCSCAGDSRKTTMPLVDVERMVEILGRWHCKAVTITGGGEPLMHPDIGAIFRLFNEAGIEMGLVTNAYLFVHKTTAEDLQRLTWCRVSISDDRKGFSDGGGALLGAMDYAVKAAPDVGWAFSYVVTREFDLDKFAFAVEYATENKFTHMRAVSDLFDLDNVPDMEWIKGEMARLGQDDSVVVYQGRKDYEPGMKLCKISLLKPVIGADGKIYPCCGAQYALNDTLKKMPDELCMGHIDDFDQIWSRQQNFDGSVCKKCYYGDYNRLLGGVTSPMDHLNFV